MTSIYCADGPGWSLVEPPVGQHLQLPSSSQTSCEAMPFQMVGQLVSCCWTFIYYWWWTHLRDPHWTPRMLLSTEMTGTVLLNNLVMWRVVFIDFVFFYDATCLVFLFTHRFTCVSSTGPDSLPSVPPWWVLRSWRCRRVTWAGTSILTTTNETFTRTPFLTLHSSFHKTASRFSMELNSWPASRLRIFVFDRWSNILITAWRWMALGRFASKAYKTLPCVK